MKYILEELSKCDSHITLRLHICTDVLGGSAKNTFLMKLIWEQQFDI